jgi:transposase
MSNYTKKAIDYTDKTVFIGLDVHKKTFSLTAICDGTVVKRETLKANVKELIVYLKRRFGSGRIKTAYESGFCGFHLHRCLVEADIDNIVVHAASIEVSKDRVKTDKRDSLKIAINLADGRLKGIYVPTVEREDYRSVTRLRDTFSKERNRTGCQIKSLLFLHGLIPAEDDRKVSEKWIKNLSNLDVGLGLKFALEQLASMWLTYNKKIKEIDLKLKEQALEDNELEKVYLSVPGIGPISARILANELGDLQQFKNGRNLSSYIGLTPSEYSSGEYVRQGHITKQGKPILRKILNQAAWVAIRHDKELLSIFERIAARAGRKKAITAISRRLIGRVRSCFKENRLYEKRPIKEPEKTCKQVA